MKINNVGLQSLATSDELAEVEVVGTPPKRRRIKFAYWQSDFQGGRIPFWHCDYLNESDFGTTLSLQGLKEWGKL
jgi:hypothetical protein